LTFDIIILYNNIIEENLAMKIIGLCGGSGSGKSMIGPLIESYGVACIDTDEVYRTLTKSDSACLRALRAEFGNEIITPDGALDRKKLASIVFEGEDKDEKRKRLNEISHKFILDETRSLIKMFEKREMSAVLVDAPLLFESGFDKECDSIIFVYCDKETRIRRIMNRDGISKEHAEKRIAAQMPDEELFKRCDFVIVNDLCVNYVRSQVREAVEQLLNK
jgi:dephospho-CoA kinase